MALPEDRKIAKILLDQIQMFFYRENIEFITIWIKNDLGSKSLLIKNGFLPIKKQKVIAKILSDSICGGGLLNQRDWLLSYGDFDGM